MTMKKRFTDELREAVGDQWDRIANHKFTKELAAGTIDREVLKRYLIQDHRFLDVGVILLASTVAHARCLQDRIPGCQSLAFLTGTENTYFERCFEAMGVTAEERTSVPDSQCTTTFCNMLREVAMNGTLGEMLAIMVVCEWTYLSWGQIVEKETVREDFVTYEWVDLHTGPYFEGVVEYWRGLLDKEAELIDEDAKCMVKKRFLQTVQFEEDFFDSAYTDSQQEI